MNKEHQHGDTKNQDTSDSSQPDPQHAHSPSSSSPTSTLPSQSATRPLEYTTTLNPNSASLPVTSGTSSDLLQSPSWPQVASSTFDRNFRLPLHDSFCFSRIPGTLLQCLGLPATLPALPAGVTPAATYENVVLLFVDAFGWHTLNHLLEHDLSPPLRRIVERSIVHTLTSQVPSTTAAHITSIHSGIPVEQTGVCEWYYYESAADAVLCPFTLSHAHPDERSTSLRADPATFLPSSAFYRILKRHQVPSLIFQERSLALSHYNKHLLADAQMVPFDSHGMGLSMLGSTLRDPHPSTRYLFYYFDGYDSAAHSYGPHHPASLRALRSFLKQFERRVMRPLRTTSQRTLVLLTADHGQVTVDASQTLYLDRLLPGLEQKLQHNSRGVPLYPTGGHRLLCLHPKDEYHNEIRESVQSVLGEKALVTTVADLIERGVWQNPSARFLRNIGSIAILPRDSHTVYWAGPNDFFVKRHRGLHSGLSPEEMDIPFLAFEV